MALNDPAVEIKHLQRCMSDLVSVLALPAVWSGQEPRKIVTTFLDALMATLDLDFLYTRVRIEPDGVPTEVLKTAPHDAAEKNDDKIRLALNERFGNDPREWQTEVRGHLGGREISLLPMRLGLAGEIGIAVAGSKRTDFPLQSERLILGVAANQVTIGLQQARLLSEQKRIADEFELRVAERTASLAAANGELKREIDERKIIEDHLLRSKDLLRTSESKLRLVIDTIPSLSWCNLPDGSNEFLSKGWHEYTGLSPEEAHGWGWQAAVHPQDLPPFMKKWQELLISGEPGEIEARLRRHDGAYRWFLIQVAPLREMGKIVQWYGTSTDIDDRKRAEGESRRSEARYRVVVETASDAVVSIDESGVIVLANPATKQIFGRTPEELIGKPLTVLMPGTMRKLHETGLRQYLETGTRHLNWQGTEMTALRANGEQFPAEVSFGEMTVDRRKVFTGFIRDISEKKRSQEALLASERKLSMIISAMPVLAWSARADGGAEFLNQQWLEYSGLSAEQGKDWGWTSAIHPDDLDRVNNYWKAVIAAGERMEIEARMRRFDGTYRWFLFRANPLRDESGNVVKWYGMNVDIEDRKRSEEALRESENRFRLIVDGIAGLVVIMSPMGELEVVNRQVLTYFGKTVEQLKGWSTSDAVHPDDMPAVVSAWSRSIESTSTYDVDHRMLRADGKYRWFHARGLPLCDAEGRVLRWYVLLTDIDDRKQTEEALARARAELAQVTRVTSLGVLTASIAHEVNQPLSSIITNANTCLRMLKGDPPNIDGARETVQRTIRDGNRASEVITRLRTLFNKKQIEVEPVDLNEAARAVIALMSDELQRNNVVLKHEFSNHLPTVNGDRVQLQQVILNLLRNATDAMRDVDDRPRLLQIKTEGDDGTNVQLTVRDTGIGFTPDAANRLFDSFYTTKEDGMGIGLSVSRSIIEAHRGRLWASANDGPGSSFAFSIPRD